MPQDLRFVWSNVQSGLSRVVSFQRHLTNNIGIQVKKTCCLGSQSQCNITRLILDPTQRRCKRHYWWHRRRERESRSVCLRCFAHRQRWNTLICHLCPNPGKLAIKQFLRMRLTISTNESADGKGKQLFIRWQSPVSQQVAPITSECVRLSRRWAQVKREIHLGVRQRPTQILTQGLQDHLLRRSESSQRWIDIIRAAFEHQSGPSNTTSYRGLETERRTWERNTKVNHDVAHVWRFYYLGVFVTLFDNSC